MYKHTFKQKEPEKYANKLFKTFGKPSCISSSNNSLRLEWYNLPKPYIEIKLIDEYIKHTFPKPHHDFVYSTISLKKYGYLDERTACSLLKVSGSIIIDLLKQEITARCGGLTANDVTLSFVVDVIQKKAKPTKKEYAYRINNKIVTNKKFNSYLMIE